MNCQSRTQCSNGLLRRIENEKRRDRTMLDSECRCSLSLFATTELRYKEEDKFLLYTDVLEKPVPKFVEATLIDRPVITKRLG